MRTMLIGTYLVLVCAMTAVGCVLLSAVDQRHSGGGELLLCMLAAGCFVGTVRAIVRAGQLAAEMQSETTPDEPEICLEGCGAKLVWVECRECDGWGCRRICCGEDLALGPTRTCSACQGKGGHYECPDCRRRPGGC